MNQAVIEEFVRLQRLPPNAPNLYNVHINRNACPRNGCPYHDYHPQILRAKNNEILEDFPCDSIVCATIWYMQLSVQQ